MFSCKPFDPNPANSSSIYNADAAAASDGSQAFHATRYEETHSFSCSSLAPRPSNDQLIAVTENSPLLTSKGINLVCPDKWFPIDFNNPKWQSNHWFAQITKDQLIENVFKKVSQSFRFNKGVWELNEPDCTAALRTSNVCGMQVKIKGHAQGGGREVVAAIYDVCPENHWNNAPKDLPSHPQHVAMGVIGNPCKRGTPTVDIHINAWNQLGLPASEGTASVSVGRM